MDELVAQQQAIEQQWAAARRGGHSQRMVDKAQVHLRGGQGDLTPVVMSAEVCADGVKANYGLPWPAAVRYAARFACPERRQPASKPGLLGAH